jgi:hypothetical protein
MRVFNIRNALVGWLTMELGKRALQAKTKRLQPWRKEAKRGFPWRMFAAGAAGAVGVAWLTRKVAGDGEEAPPE